MRKFRVFRSISKELRRIDVDRWDGISGVVIRRNRREGRVTFEDEDEAGPSLSWRGTEQAALARLRSIPSGAGEEAFWRALSPEEADAVFRELHEWEQLQQRLHQELYRVDVNRMHFGGGASLLVGDSADGQRVCTISERILTSLDPEIPTGSIEPVERWSGDIQDALARLALLPDGAGLLAFWRVFVPELAEEPRVVLEETRRKEGRALERELKRLRMDDPELGYSLDFVSRLGTPGEPLTWIAYEARWGPTALKTRQARWQGPAHEALDRLKTLADNSDVDEALEVLSR